jgi:FixJ family two-component response regulator
MVSTNLILLRWRISMPKPKAVKSVVIVDDDEAVLSALVFSLGAEGYSIRPFRNAATMLDAPRLAEADCLVIDHNLPDANGIDVVVRLRSQGVCSPAVIITSQPPARMRARAALLGVTIVEKPLLGDQLSGRVRDLIAARQRR